MEKDKSLCTLIYRFLAVRIRVGYYKPGDQILSKPICDLFDISNITVRNALRLLEREQYISLTKNQRAVVIWDASGENPPLPDDFFVDQETLIDLHKSYALIQTAVLWHGLRLFGTAELEELERVPDTPHPVSDKPAVYLFKRIIAQFGNPLLQDLQRDILLFTYPTALKCFRNRPDLESEIIWKQFQSFYQMIVLCREKEDELLNGMIDEIYESFGQYPAYTDQGTLQVPPQPYRWGKTQIGFAVSSTLIVRIRRGDYPVNTYLPSNEALAREFSVSQMTIRRNIWMLNRLGITETVNGVGTKVILRPEGERKVRWDRPDIQKHLLNFLCSEQMLAVTCRRVTQATLPLIPAEERLRMADELEAAVSVEFFHAVFGVWLERIVRYSDLAGIREIYGRLKSFLIWGLPLRFSEKRRQFSDEVRELIDSLRRGDEKKFVDDLERYCYVVFVTARQVMVDLGIRGAEAVAVPLIDVPRT